MRLAAGSRRILVFCMAVSQDCNQIGSWLIYWGVFFSFVGCNFCLTKITALCTLVQKKHYDFFSQQDNYFGVSRSKMVTHMTKWIFIQCALLPLLPGQVEGFSLRS